MILLTLVLGALNKIFTSLKVRLPLIYETDVIFQIVWIVELVVQTSVTTVHFFASSSGTLPNVDVVPTRAQSRVVGVERAH